MAPGLPASGCTRMRHRFHSTCPYFAMFPETFVEKHLAATTFAGVVFDPFCGRGTTVFESLVRDRAAAGCDVRMPRTISTKPAYSVRWWKKHGYTPPARDVFAILRHVNAYRYRTPHPRGGGGSLCRTPDVPASGFRTWRGK